MRKIFTLLVCVILIVTFLSIIGVWNDHETLTENLIRLHVVANSDSESDQQIKLKVKDAVVEYLQPITEHFTSKEEVVAYYRENLLIIQEYVNGVLKDLGAKEEATVTLEPEAFGTREYDTFTLPSGIYDSLRIKIGEAEGKNWWCVVFPSLCVPTSKADFHDTAVSAGFSQKLTDTISNDGRYEVRFLLLDWMGKLQNLFH